MDVTVTVDKAANPATVTDTASVTKGGNTVDLAGNVTKNGATGEITYAITGEANGCSLERSVLTSGNTAGTVTVNVTVAEDDNYNASAAMPITVTINDKQTQTITASDVTATYGDTDKSVSATTNGDGAISYAVKSGSEDYIEVDASTGALTIKKAGTAVVVVTAAETNAYTQAIKEVTVTINKAAAPVVTAPTLDAVTYDPAKTLTDVTLPTGWAWTDSTIVPTVINSGYAAALTVDDTNYDYTNVTGYDVSVHTVTRTVALTVNRAANPASVTGAPTVMRGGNTVDLAGNVSMNGAAGTVSYAISGEANGCTVDSSGVLTSGDSTGSVIVNVTVSEDDNYNASAALPITVTINEKNTQTITASDVTAIYGETGKSVSASTDGDGTLSYAVASGDAVTVDAASGALTIVKAGTAVIAVTAGETQTYLQAEKDVTVTINKASSTMTLPTPVNSLKFTGSVQELINAGSTDDGEMQYALGTDASTEPEASAYSPSIPTGTEAGTYTVWYKVVGDSDHEDSVPDSISVTISGDPWPLDVEIHNYTNTGAKGVPDGVPQITFHLTIQIVDKDSGDVVSAASDVAVEFMGGQREKISVPGVVFDRNLGALSEAEYKVVVTGFPENVESAVSASQVYHLSSDAWPGDGDTLVTIYLKWDDGSGSGPEVTTVYSLPEDEIGAYTQDAWGNKTYLLFHTYDICMQWLGSDDLCRGYERCFHKESPYENPFVKGVELIELRVNDQ